MPAVVSSPHSRDKRALHQAYQPTANRRDAVYSTVLPSSAFFPLMTTGFAHIIAGFTAWALLVPSVSPAAQCGGKDLALKPVIQRPSAAAQQRARDTVASMVATALKNSQAIGAAELLTRAALAEERQARAARLPAVNMTLGAQREGGEYAGQPVTSGLVRRGSISIDGLILDGGRTRGQVNWRSQLARVAQLEQVSIEEQIALRTVTLALERSRLYKQGQVYRQHESRLKCLQRAVQKIVTRDPGRRSELVQAKKTLQEAQLALQLSSAQKQRVEFDLQLLVGNQMPRLEGLTILLLETPALSDLLSASGESGELQALLARSQASEALAAAARAERRPSVGWQIRQAVLGGARDERDWSAGITIQIPVFNATNQHSIDAAVARAQADQVRHRDAVSQRQNQLAELHVRALNQTARLTAVDEVLDNSQKLRNYTQLQWSRLGKRTLFDVMSAEQNHYGLRIAYVNTLHDRQQAHALMYSLGGGINQWLAQQQTRTSP